MAKSIFVCQACGAEHRKWIGQCPDCSEWNSISEQVLESSTQRVGSKGKALATSPITEISSQSQSEMSVHDDLVSRSANEQISTRTLETQISNYKVLKSEQVANEIFVQVSMSRQDFIKSTSSRLKEILDALKRQQIILLEAKDNARDSDLNLSFGYTRHGVDDSLSDAHSENLDNNDYSLMLEYTHPLGNRQASGNYQAQVASKRQLEADTQQRMIDVESNLANSQIQEAQLIIALKSSDRKIELATKKIKQEQRLYKIGKLDLFELLRDQTTQLESRLNRERLFAQLLVLRLNIGELLDRNLETYSASTKLADVITEEQ